MNKDFKLNKSMLKYVVAGVLVLGAAAVAISNISPQSANAQDGTTQAASSQSAAQIGADMAANMETAWAVRCNEGVEAEAAESKRGKCEMFQRQDIKETGERIIEFAIGYPEEENLARGIFILPTGILLQEGMQLRIDEHEPMQFHARYCVPNGCIAYVAMDEALIAKMEKGQNAFVDVLQIGGQTITIPMPLKGFSKTLNEIKS
jgi:invasion protein IalB